MLGSSDLGIGGVVSQIPAIAHRIFAVLSFEAIGEAHNVILIDFVIIQQGISRLILHMTLNRFCSVF
jgi:hypothetical protein